MEIDTALKQMVSQRQAYHYQILPYRKQAETLWLYCTPRDDMQAFKNELETVLGCNVGLTPAEPEQLALWISCNYRKVLGATTGRLHYSDGFLLNVILDAQQAGSSDIHFEPFDSQGRIRIRIDGKLIERYIIPREEYPSIINQIKIMSQLDISERRLPQDGRIRIKSARSEFDMRVSVLPTLYGEKAVLRILSRDTSSLSLSELGFEERDLQMYRRMVSRPNGIVLISGPTGSGKTTTLYATLKELNKPDSNILTIEDPIEYTLEGINQVQLRENIGLDFSKALKTFLRQDPDIIMVGEIRDAETANMAIRAALTGHLVFSTIHTNSAWATVSRLADMGVPEFLIAATLNMSVAQRLVRRLCPKCSQRKEVRGEDVPYGIKLPAELTHHHVSVGCPDCYYTGYSGRKALYEIVPVDTELAALIRTGKFDAQEYFAGRHIETIAEKALQCLQKGETSIQEALPLINI